MQIGEVLGGKINENMLFKLRMLRVQLKASKIKLDRINEDAVKTEYVDEAAEGEI